MKQPYHWLSLIFVGSLVLTSCGPMQPADLTASAAAADNQVIAAAPAATATAQPTEAVPAISAVEQPPKPSSYGPNPQDFPAGINPLTGEAAANPAELNFPAVLISITNFPPSARPQAGLSFSPMVFEIYITEGMTRFLAAFYGDFPKLENVPVGGCDVRQEPFVKDGQVIGNHVWWDESGEGMQNAAEPSVGGLCIKLHDAATSAVVQTTTTDANGFYGFNVPAGGQYYIEFVAPKGFSFTNKHVGDDGQDSDADPASGRTDAFNVSDDNLSLDAGIVKKTDDAVFVGPPPPHGKKGEVASEVGPVRSGRLPYAHVRDFFQWSCLVYASAAKEVEARLRGCQMVYGQDSHDINSAMLDVTKVQELAVDNKHDGQPFNYTGNVFSTGVPADGAPVSDLQVFYSFLNQSKWVYDTLAGAWMRYTDQADGSGNFVPDTDRLTGKQIYFDNVIVMMAAHDVVTSSMVDIELGIGNKGIAYLFRDGQVFRIRWTTVAGDYEKTTGLRRPVQFTDDAGNPVALKPGHTWVHVMTQFSFVQELSAGHWRARFIAPAGAK